MLTNPIVKVGLPIRAPGIRQESCGPLAIDDQGDVVPSSEIEYIMVMFKPESIAYANVRTKGGMLYRDVEFCVLDEVIP